MESSALIFFLVIMIASAWYCGWVADKMGKKKGMAVLTGFVFWIIAPILYSFDLWRFNRNKNKLPK